VSSAIFSRDRALPKDKSKILSVRTAREIVQPVRAEIQVLGLMMVIPGEEEIRPHLIQKGTLMILPGKAKCQPDRAKLKDPTLKDSLLKMT